MANILEDKIVDKVGMDETLDKYFVEELELSEENGEISFAKGFYTYEGNVYIIDSNEMDVAFEDYDDENQQIIYTAIISNNYE